VCRAARPVEAATPAARRRVGSWAPALDSVSTPRQASRYLLPRHRILPRRSRGSRPRSRPAQICRFLLRRRRGSQTPLPPSPISRFLPRLRRMSWIRLRQVNRPLLRLRRISRIRLAPRQASQTPLRPSRSKPIPLRRRSSPTRRRPHHSSRTRPPAPPRGRTVRRSSRPRLRCGRSSRVLLRSRRSSPTCSRAARSAGFCPASTGQPDPAPASARPINRHRRWARLPGRWCPAEGCSAGHSRAVRAALATPSVRLQKPALAGDFVPAFTSGYRMNIPRGEIFRGVSAWRSVASPARTVEGQYRQQRTPRRSPPPCRH
jgi:hypothetical protein